MPYRPRPAWNAADKPTVRTTPLKELIRTNIPTNQALAVERHQIRMQIPPKSLTIKSRPQSNDDKHRDKEREHKVNRPQENQEQTTSNNPEDLNEEARRQVRDREYTHSFRTVEELKQYLGYRN